MFTQKQKLLTFVARALECSCRKYCEKKEFPVPNPNPWASLPRLIPHNKIDNNVELKTRANVNYVGIIHMKKK